jgi:hypothetical protein
MARYVYNGETDHVFPTLGLTVKQGDSFDGPDGLVAQGLSYVSSGKTAPAVPVAPKEAVKETTTTSAPSGTTAGE